MGFQFSNIKMNKCISGNLMYFIHRYILLSLKSLNKYNMKIFSYITRFKSQLVNVLYQLLLNINHIEKKQEGGNLYRPLPPDHKGLIKV